MNPFVALSDPTRRHIIESLADGETSFGDIAERYEMSKPAVSQHLKVLREAGLVKVRKDAQRRLYRIDTAGLDSMDEWIARVRSFWNPRLDELERILNEPE